MNLDELLNKIDSNDLSIPFGRIIKITPTAIYAKGLDVAVGDIVKLELDLPEESVLGMVTGITDKDFTIIPFSFIEGLKVQNRVFLEKNGLSVKCGKGLLGRVVNAIGEPMDDKGKIKNLDKKEPINKTSMPALKRGIIDKKFSVGVKSIDSMLTAGKGQKMGIFAGSGVGKSTLMGMIVKGCEAKIKVVALIGERGREIPEFIHFNLKDDLTNTVIVAATSDESALMRKYGAFTAMSIAEYFRDQGMDVLLMMDSVTRFAMAQREIGLSTGEPPVSRGYPPSVFSLLPQLMERAGSTKKGSITAFFTVLVDGDDMSEPIADQSRSILDGHIVLSRELTEQGFYPPVNILKSASRVMDKVVTKDHYNDSLKLKRILSLIKENEVLIRVGAYKKGNDSELDNAIARKNKIREFLTQDINRQYNFNEIIDMFRKVLR